VQFLVAMNDALATLDLRFRRETLATLAGGFESKSFPFDRIS